jgi:hypothetical protein
MRRRLPPARQAVTIDHQVTQMRRDFPACKYSRPNNVPTWRGSLQPTEISPVYTIKIVYRFAGWRSKSPRVWVESPAIRPDVPHRYDDDSLCLYFPREGSWTPDKFISQTIVPWAALWLVFYEIWLDTDHWYGPEVPHTGTKRG